MLEKFFNKSYIHQEFKQLDSNLFKSMAARSPKTYFSNPLNLIDATGYKDKPYSLSYDILRKMATKNSVIGAIILTRVNQVSNFCKPSRFSKDHLGFEIKTRDPVLVPSKEQQKVILALELFLQNCGFDEDLKRDSFETFIKKIVRDSLIFDQLCFEVVPDHKGRPAEFLAVDASTIRAASEKNKSELYNEYTNDPNAVSWVQVIDEEIVATFNSKELAFGVRNPRTDINLQPYGFSELEQIISQVTSHLFAEDYNARFFSQGGTTKGIINIKEDPNLTNRETIESFKRQWQAQVTGLTGAWKTPVLQVPGGLEYLNVSQSNREMEFEKWMNYLINICCAVYQIDPAEVNFPNNGGVGGKSSSLIDNGTSDKIKNSKDKGLRPLLVFIQDLINKYIISQFTDDFVFVFSGLDEKSDKEISELDSAAVKTYKTVNEIRAEHNKEPINNGDIILDGVFVQNLLQQQQMEQQQQMMIMQNIQQQVAMRNMQNQNPVPTNTPANTQDTQTSSTDTSES